LKADYGEFFFFVKSTIVSSFTRLGVDAWHSNRPPNFGFVIIFLFGFHFYIVCLFVCFVVFFSVGDTTVPFDNARRHLLLFSFGSCAAGHANSTCPANYFRCPDGSGCRLIAQLCDGAGDCADRWDEGPFCRKLGVL